MLVSKGLIKYFATICKPTILQNLRSYKNSAAQSHLHDYVRDQKELKKVKSTLDYQFITRESTGILMFREFAFQQITQQTLVPHLNCDMIPQGIWSFQEIKKQLGTVDMVSRTQIINTQIMSQCQADIEKAFQKYYQNIGKKNYKFNLQQEINKINQMPDSEFRHFSNILHGRIQPEEVIAQDVNIIPTIRKERILQRQDTNSKYGKKLDEKEEKVFDTKYERKLKKAEKAAERRNK